MTIKRHLIVCEGESEWSYLQRLQSFLDGQNGTGSWKDFRFGCTSSLCQ